MRYILAVFLIIANAIVAFAMSALNGEQNSIPVLVGMVIGSGIVGPGAFASLFCLSKKNRSDYKRYIKVFNYVSIFFIFGGLLRVAELSGKPDIKVSDNKNQIELSISNKWKVYENKNVDIEIRSEQVGGVIVVSSEPSGVSSLELLHYSQLVSGKASETSRVISTSKISPCTTAKLECVSQDLVVEKDGSTMSIFWATIKSEKNFYNFLGITPVNNYQKALPEFKKILLGLSEK